MPGTTLSIGSATLRIVPVALANAPLPRLSISCALLTTPTTRLTTSLDPGFSVPEDNAFAAASRLEGEGTTGDADETPTTPCLALRNEVSGGNARRLETAGERVILAAAVPVVVVVVVVRGGDL
jgi:hypothetical protein